MENKVVYVSCPNCGRGWYGKVLDVIMHPIDDKTPELKKLDQFIIQGMNPTDITKPIHCMNCGSSYTPIRGGYAYPDGNWQLLDIDENTRATVMLEWVAEKVMNTKGH